MSHKSMTVFLAAVCLLSSTCVLAQGVSAEKTFKLLRDSSAAEAELALQEEEIEVWQPALQDRGLELSFALGMLGLSKTLLSHDQIIYKYTDESTYWGDVEISGQTAFAPALRLGYNLQPWFALEGIGALSFSRYTTSITNRSSRRNEANALIDLEEPALGEFDAEERSLLTVQAGLNALLYPLALGGDATGRWHPYLTVGAGRIWYDMNSNYTDGAVSSNEFNAGIGLRLLADRNISIRAEVLMRRSTLEWNPAENFLSLNEGTLLVPLNEYPIQDDGSFREQQVESFDSLDLNVLNYSIGFQGSF